MLHEVALVWYFVLLCVAPLCVAAYLDKRKYAQAIVSAGLFAVALYALYSYGVL